jgi:CheY-like chemotaxis protein
LSIEGLAASGKRRLRKGDQAMTPEMAFECLLVSRDPAMLCTLNRMLQDLSISTRICFHPSKALAELAEGGPDLIVIDLFADSSYDLLRNIWKFGMKQKPTVVAISSDDRLIPGAHVTMTRPVSTESCAKSLKLAYAKMLYDYRRHARHAVIIPLTAMDDNNCPVPITVMDIGYGGIGLHVRKQMQIGEVLSFHLSLPETRRSIYIQARVLWTRQFGRTGCEFMRVPPVDLTILHDWLVERIQVKKPCVCV